MYFFWFWGETFSEMRCYKHWHSFLGQVVWWHAGINSTSVLVWLALLRESNGGHSPSTYAAPHYLLVFSISFISGEKQTDGLTLQWINNPASSQAPKIWEICLKLEHFRYEQRLSDCQSQDHLSGRVSMMSLMKQNLVSLSSVEH